MHMAFEDKSRSSKRHEYGYVGFQPASPEPFLAVSSMTLFPLRRRHHRRKEVGVLISL